MLSKRYHTQNIFLVTLVFLILISLVDAAAADNQNYKKALVELSNDNYSQLIGKGAFEYFTIAYEEDKTVGPQISHILINYADQLADNNKLLTLTGTDAVDVYKDAIYFDATCKAVVMKKLYAFFHQALVTKDDFVHAELILEEIRLFFLPIEHDIDLKINHDLADHVMKTLKEDKFPEAIDSLKLIMKSEHKDLINSERKRISGMMTRFFEEKIDQDYEKGIQYIKETIDVTSLRSDEKHALTVKLLRIANSLGEKEFEKGDELCEFLYELNQNYTEEVLAFYLNHGISFIKDQSYDRALISFRKYTSVCSSDAKERLFKKLSQRASTALEQKNNDNAIEIFKILINLSDENEQVRRECALKIASEGEKALLSDDIADAFNKFKKSLKIAENSPEVQQKFSSISKCYIDNTRKKRDFRKAVKALDYYLQLSDSEISEEHNLMFNELIANLLSAYNIPFLESYENFKTVLSTHLFQDLQFLYLDSLWKETSENNQLFQNIIAPSETFYFYYDTGRIKSFSRGIALTDESILWRNLNDDAHRYAFDDIESFMLVYEKGLSLTGWKVRINNDPDLDIRLSQIPDEAVVAFLSALLYYININRSMNAGENLFLIIPEKERKILDGSTWQRHKGVIITTAVVAAVVTTYVVGKDTEAGQKDREKAIAWGQSAASVAAKTAKYVKDGTVLVSKNVVCPIRGVFRSVKIVDAYNSKGEFLGKFKLKELYDENKIIKMPFKGLKGDTARGFERNAKKFWEQYLDKYGSDLSKANIRRIKANRAPIVDNKWLKAYPNHKPFMGEQLHHHHLNHGGKAIPLPANLHKGANYQIWHMY